MFTAVAPGTANISVTDGTLTASDLITVTAGAVASLVLTPGDVTDDPGCLTPPVLAAGTDGPPSPPPGRARRRRVPRCEVPRQPAGGKANPDVNDDLR